MQANLTFSRRGLSTIVAALGVMTLSLVLAIGLGYLFTNTLEASLAPTTTCAPLQIAMPFSLEKTFYDPEKETLSLTITRAPHAPAFNTLTFRLISTETSVQEWACAAQCGSCLLPEPAETKTYFLTGISEPPASLSVLVDGCTLFSKPLG